MIFLNNVYASDIVNITFLGTGTPRPDITKLGPSILLKYKKNEILFDVGRGTTLRLGQLDNNYSNINDIFMDKYINEYDKILGPMFYTNEFNEKMSTVSLSLKRHLINSFSNFFFKSKP